MLKIWQSTFSWMTCILALTVRHSIFDNANEYYERGKRAKQKSAGTITAFEDSKRKLAKIERN